MEIRAPYILIGSFVLVVITAAFGFVYWLHNTGSLTGRTTYRILLRKYSFGLVNRRGGSLQRNPPSAK